jgi:hypothetical protein
VILSFNNKSSSTCIKFLLQLKHILFFSCADGQLHIVESPMRVSTLRHYCRLSLRRTVSRENLSSLCIQSSLLHYLQYVDIDSEAIPPLKERMHRLRDKRSNNYT